MFELSQSFYFEAAHTLNRDIDSEASLRIHGHTYHGEVAVSGETNPVTGMILDLAFLRREIERIRKSLDHKFLDDLDALGLPTLENLCSYIYKGLCSAIPGISAVSVERRASGDRCVLRVPLVEAPPKIGPTLSGVRAEICDHKAAKI